MQGQAEAPLVIDVREELRAGRQPLRRIMDAARGVLAGRDLILLSTFEPIPLYGVLALRGFSHEARQLPGGDWEVRFLRRGRAAAARPRPAEAAPSTGAVPKGLSWVRLDNRGLEPPEPMVRTFSALGSLGSGQALEIHNDRRPAFLYPHLQERGFSYETVDAADGSARVRIWRAAGGEP